MTELKLTNNPCKYCNGEIDDGKPLCGDIVNDGDVVEKHVKEELKAKRALWLARAERAKDRAITCDDFAYLGDTERNISMTLARNWMKCRLLKPSEWSKVWKKVERKCRAKAEEYK